MIKDKIPDPNDNFFHFLCLVSMNNFDSIAFNEKQFRHKTRFLFLKSNLHALGHCYRCNRLVHFWNLDG